MGQPRGRLPARAAEAGAQGRGADHLPPGARCGEPADSDAARRTVEQFQPGAKVTAPCSRGACIPRCRGGVLPPPQGVRLHVPHGQPCILQRHGARRDQSRSTLRTARRWSSSTSASATAIEVRHAHRAVRAQRHAPRGRGARPAGPGARADHVRAGRPAPTSARPARPCRAWCPACWCTEGDAVEQNQVLLIIEAMKMETSVVARMAGRVDKLLAAENTAVKAGELLAVIDVEQRYCCHKYSKNRRMRASGLFFILVRGKCGEMRRFILAKMTKNRKLYC